MKNYSNTLNKSINEQNQYRLFRKFSTLNNLYQYNI